MTSALRILHLEDNPYDAELVQKTLAADGIQLKAVRVQTRDQFVSELALRDYDLVLADFSLPGFDGMTALVLVSEMKPELPFILISGTVGEEIAVEALKAGANDFILKERLSRLPFAVRRALEDARQRVERKQADENVNKLSLAVEQSADNVVITDRAGIIQYVNPSFEKLTGYRKEEAIGMTPRILKSGEHNPEVYQKLWQTILSGKAFRFQFTNRKKNGELYYTEETITPIKDGRGIITHFVSTGRDITQNKLAKEALLASEERYRLLFEKNPLPMWVYDTESLCFLAVNEAAIRRYGYSKEEFLSMHVQDIRPPEDVQAFLENVKTTHEPNQESGPWKHLKKDGTIIFVEIISHDLAFAGKKARIVLSHDITDRMKAEESLAIAEDRCRSIVENALVGIFQSSPAGAIITANPATAHIYGYDSPADFISHVTDLSHQLYTDPMRRGDLVRLLEEHGSVEDFEFEASRKDGSKIWISENVRVVRDQAGKILYYEGFLKDITEQKKAQEERQLLEKQLLQSQKIEAIGQLAGGVAHDYNNTLMAIGGFAEILMMKLPVDHPLQKIAAEIQKGVSQGAELTRQLLAFSRRQVLVPRVLDLNDLISKTVDMLQRLIGEDMQLSISLAKDLGHVKADSGQMHQVILNLAVNARDAMPDGGKLTIETENIELDEGYIRTHVYVLPGRYVQLTMSDTGIGMDEDVMSRIFEPFYTTKEEGKGTGLGLSTAYGIVKQSGGYISVYSQLNRGTTFKIYLPRVDEPVGKETPRLPLSELNGHGEVILLVDDNEAIRGALSALLQMKGYSVLSSESGHKALKISADHQGPIHLLITDVVMPEMSGKDLVRSFLADRPGCKVLYMSGYTYDVISRQGILDSGAGFLSKPANAQALLTKIRELLTSP